MEYLNTILHLPKITNVHYKCDFVLLISWAFHHPGHCCSVVNNHDVSSQILTFSSEKMAHLRWKYSKWITSRSKYEHRRVRTENSEQYLEATGHENMLTVLICLFVSSPDCLYSHQCVHVDWCKAKYFSSNTPTFPFGLFATFSHPWVKLSRDSFFFFIVWKNTSSLSWSWSLDLNLLDQSRSETFAVRGSSRSHNCYVINMPLLIFAADGGMLVFKQCTIFNI